MTKASDAPHLFLKFNPESVDIIHSFIKQKMDESNADGVVIGLSGGLDSAVVTKLCADAMGPKKVLALILPDSATPEEDIRDAVALAAEFRVDYRVIDITDTIAAFSSLLSPMQLTPKALGNIKARCRMIVLYVHANLESRLVMGSSNKSEMLTGYFTKFGDGGADFAPIGDLYKTQIRELAKAIDIPQDIINKTPSAGLAEGQTDEGELGITYDALDRILLGIELKLKAEDIAEKVGCEKDEVLRIHDMVRKNVHKRKMPLIPKIGIRTFGLDWRE
ncbi:MAG: NAD+ synthase [Thermoplasmata archaeon]|nr:MAG: NAD+ synthase [Thermoplasmata archaeon]